MNAAPYCVGLCLFYLPLLSVLGMSSINLLPYLIFTYRSTRSISAPPLIICRVPPGPRCQPVSGSVRIVITVCYQLSFTLCSSLVRCSGESHDADGLVATARTLVRPLSAGRFSINLFSSDLFLHHLDYHLLIVMDNNVRDCILLPSFLSLLSCRIYSLYSYPLMSKRCSLY